MCEHNLVDSQQRSFSHCYSCTTQPGTCTPERDPMLADNWFGHNWIIDDIYTREYHFRYDIIFCKEKDIINDMIE